MSTIAKRILIAALVVLLTGTAAHAEGYAGFHTGLYKVAGNSDIEEIFGGNISAGEFNSGTAGFVCGWYFTPNLGAELAIDAFTPTASFRPPGVDPDITFAGTSKLGMFPISLSARYRLWPERFTPIAMGGFSVNAYRFEIDFPLRPGLGLDQSGVELGFQAGVGVELPFGLRWRSSALLQYRFAEIPVSVLGSDGRLLEFNPNFGGFQLLLGFGYIF